jgi:cyclopropane fatty-acyl-phospholipid synthase-like methyltransferase
MAHFLWPHHQQHVAFFDAAFLEPMSLVADQRFVEVGVGTGLYSRRLLEKLPGATGLGVDISPASAAFAARHVEVFGLSDRYEVVLQDVVAEPLDPCDWLVCFEVLEHLEDPVTFLASLKGSLAPGGKAFVTAALNAAHVDHIYLYETVEDVIANLRDAGFDLEQGFIANAHRPAKPGLPVPAVAAFVVL